MIIVLTRQIQIPKGWHKLHEPITPSGLNKSHLAVYNHVTLSGSFLFEISSILFLAKSIQTSGEFKFSM